MDTDWLNLRMLPINENSITILVVILVSSWLAFIFVILLLRHKHTRQMNELVDSKTVLENENEKLQWSLHQTQSELNQLENEHRQLRVDERAAAIELTAIQSRFDEQKKHMSNELERLSSLKNNVVSEFEKLLGQLVQGQQKQFVTESQQKVEAALSPLQKQLDGFRRRVDEVHSEDVAQTHRLLGQIQQLQQQSKQIGEEAIRLTSALKGNNKVMGDWGEWILQRLLEDSGLLVGRDFTVQASTQDDNGRRLQPDVILNLPGDKQVIIDSKVSLIAYERLVHADGEESKQGAEKDLIQSLKQHMKGLFKKRYDQLPEINSPDFVVMFIPVEPAYILALQISPSLLKEARENKVVLAGPTTLMAILQMVEALWQREKQDQNVSLIMREAGKLYDQFVRFTDSMTDVGLAIDRAKKSYDLSMSRLRDGKGNLVRRVQHLQELGAKNQKVLELETEKVTEVD